MVKWRGCLRGIKISHWRKGMQLTDIKKINQRIYESDTNISRNSKVIFVAAIVICLKTNRDFRDSSKLTTLIDFTSSEVKPIDQLIKLANDGIDSIELQHETKDAVKNSFKLISGVNTNLDRDKSRFHEFLKGFISNDFALIGEHDLFFETLYMEIDKKADRSDAGIVLTPIFIARLMVDLAEIDYKRDVVADLCSGTGLFSLLAYSKMINDMNADLDANRITRAEWQSYKDKLFHSIIANDNEPKMVTLCLANFLLNDLSSNLIYCKDVLSLRKSDFKINDDTRLQPTKAILNPPYEDSYKPVEIIEQNINLIKDGTNNNKLVVIVPPQKFGQKKDVFSKILNLSTLEVVIKTQDDLFVESGKAQPASIFVFNASRPHKRNDIIRYYDFTDTGYVYLKDSGLVDKNKSYEAKKAYLLNKIKSGEIRTNNGAGFVRTWTNFYDVNKEIETDAKIDPSKIKTNKEEADITLENITIKKMLQEKQMLIDSVNNNFKDEDGSFEKYIVNILSED